MFSRILLGLQLSFSLIAVIGGLVFMHNANHQKNVDFGYDKESLIGIDIENEQQYNTFKNVLEQNPKVQSYAGSRQHVGYWVAHTDYQVKSEVFDADYIQIGDNYLETVNLELLAGRKFDKNRETDYQTSILINQKLANEMGWKEPIGQKITMDSVQHEVIGLLADFTQSNQFRPIQPVIMAFNKPERYRYIVLKSSPENLIALKGELTSEWNQLFPYSPFRSFYQNEVLTEVLLISNNVKWMYFFLAFATILLTSTGLYALISLNILKRMKEIAIRKVIGASMGNIAILINKNYFWIFVVAAITGCAGGTYLANTVLDSIFASSVGTNPVIMISSSIGLFVLTGLIMGYKIMLVRNINPSEILRSE